MCSDKWTEHVPTVSFIHANMNDIELNAAYITLVTASWSRMSDDFTSKFVRDSSLKSVVWVFQTFYWWLRARFSSTFRMTPANEPKNGNCILPGSVLQGSDELSMGKWTTTLCSQSGWFNDSTGKWFHNYSSSVYIFWMISQAELAFVWVMANDEK